MATIDLLLAFGSRALLVALFLPFSALDKLFNFRGAARQAAEAVGPGALSRLLVLAGLAVEVLGSLAILLGVADRAAAVVLAGYCAVTALLWKRFWRPGDFWADPDGRGRALFWDFLKNLALAGGFLGLAFAAAPGAPGRFTVAEFLADPLASSRPYERAAAPAPPALPSRNPTTQSPTTGRGPLP